MPKRRTVDEESELGSTVDEEEMPMREKERPAKRGRSAFIQDEVDVESDDEDLSDDEEEGDDQDEYEEDAGAEAIDRRTAERQNRALDAQRRKEEDEKLREQVRQRYEGEGATRFTHAEDEDDGGRFQELPDATRDPKLWLMKCKPNAEKMLVISLMQKYLDSMHTEKPLQIKSAMCTDVKGYIYIEAYKEVHVREATQGLNNLFYKITQVCARRP